MNITINHTFEQPIYITLENQREEYWRRHPIPLDQIKRENVLYAPREVLDELAIQFGEKYGLLVPYFLESELNTKDGYDHYEYLRQQLTLEIFWK